MGDVVGLRVDGVDAVVDDVFDGGWVDVAALHQRVECGGVEIGWMDAGEGFVALVDWCLDGVDDVGFGYVCYFSICGLLI